MKKLFPPFALWCLSILSANFIFGQTASLCRDALASAGGNAFLANKNFEYTLGESVIASIGNGAILLSQGFHQREVCSITVGTIEISQVSGLNVFPNPTAGELHLQFAEPTGKSFQLQVLNALGQLVQTLPMSDDTMRNTIDCRAFPVGTYFLIGRNADSSLFFQVPFVKSDR